MLGLLLLRVADLGVGEQAADALAQQGRRVGHATHDCLRARAQPALQAVAADAGGDRDDQGAVGQMRSQILTDRLHDLRLDRQHHHVGAGQCIGVLRERLDAVLGADFRALLGAWIAGANGVRCDALGAQPADQTGSHVAGADEGDAG